MSQSYANTSEPFVKTLVFLQYAVFATAIILTSIQFICNMGMTQDEAALGAEIIEKSFTELHKPLGRHQSAPVAFLWCVKPLSILIPGEYGLRLFPLLCFWVSLFVFRKVVSLLTGNETTVVVALALFALNSQMIFHATMVKQYAADVCAALVLTLTVLGAKDGNGFRKYIGIAAAGAVGFWFSNAMPITMIVCGLYLAFGWVSSGYARRGFVRLAFVAAIWGFSSLLYYMLFVHGSPTLDFMRLYWSETNPSFMPLTGIGAAMRFVGSKTFLLLRFANGWIITSAALAMLSAVGIFDCIRRRRFTPLWFAYAGLAVAFAFSSLWLYPAYDRFLLFAFPFMVLPAAQGTSCVIGFVKWRKLRAVSVFAVPILMFGLAVAWFPIRYGEIRKAAKFVSENILPGDEVHVYKPSHYDYYRLLGKDVFNWDNPTKKLGRQPEQNMKGRVWILAENTSGRWKAQCYEYRKSDQEAEGDEFANLFTGGKKLSEYRATGAFALLFDFGESDE